MIRGYEDIKLGNVERFRAEAERLTRELDSLRALVPPRVWLAEHRDAETVARLMVTSATTWGSTGRRTTRSLPASSGCWTTATRSS